MRCVAGCFILFPESKNAAATRLETCRGLRTAGSRPRLTQMAPMRFERRRLPAPVSYRDPSAKAWAIQPGAQRNKPLSCKPGLAIHVCNPCLAIPVPRGQGPGLSGKPCLANHVWQPMSGYPWFAQPGGCLCSAHFEAGAHLPGQLLHGADFVGHSGRDDGLPQRQFRGQQNSGYLVAQFAA